MTDLRFQNCSPFRERVVSKETLVTVHMRNTPAVDHLDERGTVGNPRFARATGTPKKIARHRAQPRQAPGSVPESIDTPVGCQGNPAARRARSQLLSYCTPGDIRSPLPENRLFPVAVIQCKASADPIDVIDVPSVQVRTFRASQRPCHSDSHGG